MTFRYRPVLAATALALANVIAAHAEPAPFDLVGPTLDVRVTRGAQTLPISQVPNLAGGDHRHAVRALPADRGVPARRDQPTAEGMVLQLRDLEPQVRAGFERDRAA